MNAEDIVARVESSIAQATAKVVLEGSHCQITVISDQFKDLNRVKKQQLVYACLNDEIADGTLHAITINTYTEAEWGRASKFLPS